MVRIRVTEHPTAAWAAQQILECCGWDREPPRFLIHDRDGRYGALFDRRLQSLGITQANFGYPSCDWELVSAVHSNMRTSTIRHEHHPIRYPSPTV